MQKNITKEHSCCVIGHRIFLRNEKLVFSIKQTLENLIIHSSVDTFFFGSKSAFNDLCYQLVTELKQTYPHIRRVYVRAEFPVIDENYEAYLLERYEHTYFPSGLENAGRSVYVQRNKHMVDVCKFCVVYYDQTYFSEKQGGTQQSMRKSGTKIALEYAAKKQKRIYLFSKE